MGRTVPSYRLASYREKRKYKIFREKFDKSERKTFDENDGYSKALVRSKFFISF